MRCCLFHHLHLASVSQPFVAFDYYFVAGFQTLLYFNVLIIADAGLNDFLFGTVAVDRINPFSATAILDLGGRPVVRPLVHFEPTASIKIRPSKAYNLLVVTSPTAARLLLRQLASPVQYLPKRLAVTGPGTAEPLAFLNIDTLMPERDYSARGLLATLPEDLAGWKILRVRSEEAGPALAQALKARGARVKDLPFYRTLPVPDVEPPPHDAVFLASASAVRAWAALPAVPRDVPLLAMGGPTAEAIVAAGFVPASVPSRQTVEDALLAFAKTRLP